MQNRIKETIHELGLTQKDIAESLGMTTVGLNQIVNGGMPKFETFSKIAAVLGVPAWRLFLSDEDLEDIRGFRMEPSNHFKCPACGASLKVEVCED